jgi:hypothetical protein
MSIISIQVTLGSAPRILTRYTLSFSLLEIPYETSYGPGGGVFETTISMDADLQSLPLSLEATINVDFDPSSGLASFSTKKLIRRNSLNDPVYQLIYEIGQLVRASTIIFDFPWPFPGYEERDFLVTDWSYISAGKLVSNGSFFMSSEECVGLQRRVHYNLLDPEGVGDSGVLRYTMSGRLQDTLIKPVPLEVILPDGIYSVARPVMQGAYIVFTLFTAFAQ